MEQESNRVRRKRSGEAELDASDRKLLALLAENSSRSYAELAKELHLSPPAVHERVKRLRQSGIIKGTVARLDGARVGRPLLAFVHVFYKSLVTTQLIVRLSMSLTEIEEIHTLTGESAMLLKVRTTDTTALERLLAQIHSIEGSEGTRTYIALSTFLERGPIPAA